MSIRGYINKLFPILPLVYDDTLSFMELVSKLMKKTNEVVEVANKSIVSINGLEPTDGELTLTASDVGALPDTYDSPVVSVNGQVGVVTLDAEDVGALADDTPIPTKTSELENDSGFITAAQAGAVTSVNGEVGVVVLDADDVGAVSYDKTQSLTATQIEKVKQNIDCQASSTIPSSPGVASAGSSTNYARGDHVHGMPYVDSTNGVWNIRKWNDGTIEASAKISKSMAMTSASGSTYICTTITENFPANLFTSVTLAEVTSINSNGNFIGAGVIAVSAANIQFFGRSATSQTITVEVDIYCRGV